MAQPLFKGAIPALVTPFKDGEVDEPAFRANLAGMLARSRS